ASLTLMSSIGVQEYELLGDYTLNHALHGIQLFVLWSLDRFTPNFGKMEEFLLNYQYGRNFFDTDQRELKSIILDWDGPALVMHGENDRLVPLEAALEHHRLMPHSELVLYSGVGHLAVYAMPNQVAADLEAFWASAEAGEAKKRGDYEEGFLVSAEPVERERDEWLAGVLLGIATFGSEDLACIGGGLLASKGSVSLWVAIVACLSGIFVGDMGIYLMGRVMGPSALRLPLVRWMLSEKKVDRCARWFEKRGVMLVLSTRFVPGSRVPTYFAAGVLKVSFLRFAGALFLAASIWTPAIVGLTYFLGGAFLDFFEAKEGWVLLGLGVTAISLLLLARLAAGLATWRGRRLLYSKWRRLTRWEFWPAWALYPPVVLYILWRMLKHRSLTLVTLVNPCMPTSGLVFESKSQILKHLDKFGVPVGRFDVLPLEVDIEEKVEKVGVFLERVETDYPVVLKPDSGQRGQGVQIVKSEAEARAFFADQVEDTIVQEFLPGREYGIFYYRLPHEEHGAIYSITDKRFTAVMGDGEADLETLILRDERAVCMAEYFLEAHADRLSEVPSDGENIVLADLGTHCRGSLFLDGEALLTKELCEEIDEMTRGVEGFYFGRYDIRVPSEDDLAAGRNIRIIELNGMTSEATNMYDPKHGLGFAYRTLFHLWGKIFEIAAENRKRGYKPDSVWRLSSLIFGYVSGKSSKELG
ncbi:MAG: VTT domain-containing protein, partial [Verrucomicrobiota bacterium]